MTEIWLILIWMLVTLALGCFSAFLGKRYGVEYIIATMAALVVIANVLANKMVTFWDFTVPAAVLVYATSFLLTDVLSEKWGKAEARKAVWAGFYANIVLAVSVLIAVNWQSPEFAKETGAMFNTVLGMTPRIVVASMIAYLVSQHHDVMAFHFWKKKTKGRYLWLRNNASTVVSQLIDSVLFITIAFYGVLPVVPLIIGQWVVKVIIAALDTPFCYFACRVVEKTEQK